MPLHSPLAKGSCSPQVPAAALEGPPSPGLHHRLRRARPLCVGPRPGRRARSRRLGKGRGGWPRASSGAEAGWERGEEGVVAVCLPWVRAGSCRPPPLQSLLHLPVSLTHFRERGGPRREGERGGRVGKGIDVGPSLPRSMPGRERRCHRTPSSQIECGLTIRRRTEDSRRLGRGRSSGPAPRLSFRLAPGVLLRVLDRGPPTLTFGGQSASYSQQSVPLAQSPTPRTPFPTQGSRQHACFLSCFNLAGRSGRPQPVSNS